jgi:hypothetical protein
MPEPTTRSINPSSVIFPQKPPQQRAVGRRAESRSGQRSNLAGLEQFFAECEVGGMNRGDRLKTDQGHKLYIDWSGGSA